MKLQIKIIILLLCLIGAAFATHLLQQDSDGTHDSTQFQPEQPQAPLEEPPSDAPTFSLQTENPISKSTLPPQHSFPWDRPAIQNKSTPPPQTAKEIAEPLPDSPFLSADAPVNYTAPIAQDVNAQTDSASLSSLSWMQLAVGTASLSQTQEDRTYSETRSITNPLTILMGLGTTLTQTLGLEFSWRQQVVSGAGKNNNLPNSQMTAGISWQPVALTSNSSFWRWGFGAGVSEATYIKGDPTTSQLANYAKTDLYGSVQYSRHLANLWYLDVKLLLTLSPIKVDTFTEYADNGWLLRIAPQYEFSKNLRVGIALDYINKNRRLGYTNHLGQNDTATISLKEFQSAVLFTYSF